NEDSKLVQKIVQNVCDKIYSESEPADKTSEFVGISFHKKCMKSLLSVETKDVQMVGVWGMGCRGKTTIAKYVFDDISSQFPARCFVENVKTDSQKHGASHLWKQIMSDIFPKTDHV
ncbi:hypothetical protein EUTSA_v10027301mg, partial [Eutrema salsugineum]